MFSDDGKNGSDRQSNGGISRGRRTGSLGFDTATATAASAETDGALYVQVSYCSGKTVRLDAEVKRMKSPTLRKTATRDPTSWAMNWFFGFPRRR